MDIFLHFSHCFCVCVCEVFIHWNNCVLWVNFHRRIDQLELWPKAGDMRSNPFKCSWILFATIETLCITKHIIECACTGLCSTRAAAAQFSGYFWRFVYSSSLVFCRLKWQICTFDSRSMNLDAFWFLGIKFKLFWRWKMLIKTHPAQRNALAKLPHDLDRYF